MIRKDIIRMAREAGIVFDDKAAPFYERFAALIAAAEREACAKVCDAKYEEYPDEEMDLAFALSAKELAAAIRARGQA